MIVPAKGVQIYECRAKKAQASAHEWTFVGPRPICLIQTKSICRHYAGPHWESTDGIKIAGTVKKSADALQADHILVASCDEVCRLAGSFSKTTSIQRVNTVGA